MAPPPKGVLFGPIKDWGLGHSKLILEFDGEDGVKKVRQYVLEDMAGWYRVPEFGDRGKDTLEGAGVRTARTNNEEEEEVLRVTDGPSAERAIELLDRGLIIQDAAANGELDGLDVEVVSTERNGDLLETITVKPRRPDGEAVESWAHTWQLSTPSKARRRAAEGTVRQQVEIIMGIVDEEEEVISDNKAVAMRSCNKKGKGKGQGMSIEELAEEMGTGWKEAERPQDLDEVRKNIFGTTPPGFRIDQNTQEKEWNKETTQGTMAWADDTEIGDSQEEAGEPDTDMGEGGELTEGKRRTGERQALSIGLEGSQHAVPELTKEEAERLVEELVEKGEEMNGEEKEGMEDDEDMEEEEAEAGAGGSWQEPYEPRSEMEVVEAIMRNAKTLEEIDDLKRDQRLWRSSRDYEMAKSLIATLEDCIEGGWCADGDGAGKGGWKRLGRELVAEGRTHRILEVMDAEREWRRAREVRTSQLQGIKGELREVKEQLALLAVAMGAGTVEEQAKVKRTMNARKGQVDETKRKEKEMKKLEDKRKKAQADKKEEEEAQAKAEALAKQAKSVRDSQQKVYEACEAELESLLGMDRGSLTDEGIIELGESMKKAKEMMKKIEKEAAEPIESKSIDTKGKKDLETAVGKVNALLRETGLTTGRPAWTMTAKAGEKDFDDESKWTVNVRVAGEVERALVQVYGRSGKILNVWAEGEMTIKMLAPAIPMTIARGRKALAEKLRQENKDLVGGKRMPKV
ncbi:hypothetical protein EV426DRAFT_708895 [Tirmania nivea]|nr:hypothetical protein EV426DRAFT_708895 [Tirmania nivea]